MRTFVLAAFACLLFAPSAHAAKWGDFKDDGCVNIKDGVAYRQYSSILWNIPSGDDWKNACEDTPGTGPTADYNAVRCPEAGGHQWGEFEVPDDNCEPHWGDFKDDGCVGPDVRHYSAILWDIPHGVTWEAACRGWPAEISGSLGVQHFDQATRCMNHGGHMWGEFDYADESCD
ncbi:MAG: hypothetical protein L0H63_13385 [Nitrococcus sp.]|nr:hypothetical protein [Nitrococcus sp.]